jgi:exodeoxyribonuclease VII large subunit
VAPNKIRDLQQRFDEGTLRMVQAAQRFVSSIRHRERMLSMRLSSIDLPRFVGDKKDRLNRHYQGLISAMKARLHHERARFGIAAGKIDTLSPLGILQRGFALCRDAKGRIVKNAARVARGDDVYITLATGELNCTVKNIKN